MDTAFDTYPQPDTYPEAIDAPDPVRIEAERLAARVERVTDATLDDLARLRRFGMNMAERLDRRGSGRMDEDHQHAMGRVGDDYIAFERLGRAIRQIVALEQETVGIRPMPRHDGGGGGRSEGNDKPSGQDNLRTGSTRGARSDLLDRQETDWTDEQKAAFKDRLERVITAVDLDIAAAGRTEEGKRKSPYDRATSMIYEVPRPNFEACLHAMARNPEECHTSAMFHKWAKPGTYRRDYSKPP